MKQEHWSANRQALALVQPYMQKNAVWKVTGEPMEMKVWMAFLYGDPFTIPFKLNIPSCLSGCAHPAREQQYGAGNALPDISAIKKQKSLSNIP